MTEETPDTERQQTGKSLREEAEALVSDPIDRAEVERVLRDTAHAQSVLLGDAEADGDDLDFLENVSAPWNGA